MKANLISSYRGNFILFKNYSFSNNQFKEHFICQISLSFDTKCVNNLSSWEGYYNTVSIISNKDPRIAKRVFEQAERKEDMEKLNDEQKESLTDLKNFIYANGSKKK